MQDVRMYNIQPMYMLLQTLDTLILAPHAVVAKLLKCYYTFNCFPQLGSTLPHVMSSTLFQHANTPCWLDCFCKRV